MSSKNRCNRRSNAISKTSIIAKELSKTNIIIYELEARRALSKVYESICAEEGDAPTWDEFTDFILARAFETPQFRAGKTIGAALFNSPEYHGLVCTLHLEKVNETTNCISYFLAPASDFGLGCRCEMCQAKSEEQVA